MDLLTLLSTLVLGNYGFTAWVAREMYKFKTNHYRHLEERVTALEDRERDDAR